MGSKRTITPLPGEGQAAYQKRWRTRQKQLADYIKGMARAEQRTLEDWIPKE